MPDPIRAKLLAFRATHGLSRAKLASLLGVSKRCASKWIDGDRSLDASPAASRVTTLLLELQASPEMIGPPRGKPGRPRKSPPH